MGEWPGQGLSVGFCPEKAAQFTVVRFPSIPSPGPGMLGCAQAWTLDTISQPCPHLIQHM